MNICNFIYYKNQPMKNEHKLIIDAISIYLTHHPEIRFWQALFNLWINEFEDKINPENKEYLLRDIHNDRDEDILERIIDNYNYLKNNNI